jgi:AraC family transcriptional activator of pyochelin receptor
VSACPLKGISRGLYISGKALEIAALTLTSLEATTEGGSKINLSTKDIEKLNSAKILLEQRLRNPPSLAELGLATGLNTRKLNEGFRCVFGASVFEHLQKIRLEAAYRMLVDDEMSASSAAYQVGYSAPHFSVAFRARFGVSPKQLRHATVMADEQMASRRTHAPN